MEMDAVGNDTASNAHSKDWIVRSPNKIGTYRLYLAEIDKV